jgi:hypothetical protein
MIIATAVESNSSTLYMNNLGLTLLMNNDLGLIMMRVRMRILRMRNMVVMMIVVDDPISMPIFQYMTKRRLATHKLQLQPNWEVDQNWMDDHDHDQINPTMRMSED